jgi:hypothetical protein
VNTTITGAKISSCPTLERGETPVMIVGAT